MGKEVDTHGGESAGYYGCMDRGITAGDIHPNSRLGAAVRWLPLVLVKEFAGRQENEAPGKSGSVGDHPANSRSQPGNSTLVAQPATPSNRVTRSLPELAWKIPS